MSSDQYTATIRGIFRTQNGQAASTYSTKKYFENRPC